MIKIEKISLKETAGVTILNVNLYPNTMASF